MQRFTDCVLTRSGAAVPSASVLVKTYPAGATATIYSDDGATEQSNPITTDANGKFSFYAADGRYTLVISKTGYITQQTLTDHVLLQDLEDADADHASAADVHFTPSGTGGSTTTVQDELRARVRPEQYGAVGDGSTLDTTALTNATSAARIIEFGQNTTYFTGTFSPVSKTVLRGGHGSVIKIDDNGQSTNPSLYLNGVTDVIIEGITFTSDASSRSGVYGLIRAEGCSRLTIRNCKFLTSPSTGIYIANCSDVLIEGNEIGDGTLFTYADGIHVTRQSSRVRIIGNTLRKCQDDAIGLPSNKDTTTYTANTDIVVMGNTIDTTTVAGSGVAVVGGNNIVVAHNTIRSTFSHGISASMAGDSTYNAGVDLIIAHNNIKSAGANGINVGGLNRGVVSGNIVNGTGDSGLGIQLVGTTLSVSVTGNNVTGADDTGLYEESGSGPNIFLGNVLKGNTTAKLINGGTSSVDANNLT